jgi:hypothetical protein
LRLGRLRKRLNLMPEKEEKGVEIVGKQVKGVEIIDSHSKLEKPPVEITKQEGDRDS